MEQNREPRRRPTGLQPTELTNVSEKSKEKIIFLTYDGEKIVCPYAKINK